MKVKVGANSRIWCDLFRSAPALSIYFMPPVRNGLAARFVALQETLGATKDPHISWAWWRGVGSFPGRSIDGAGNGRTADGGNNSGNGDNGESTNTEHSGWMSYSNKCGWRGERAAKPLFICTLNRKKKTRPSGTIVHDECDSFLSLTPLFPHSVVKSEPFWHYRTIEQCSDIGVSTSVARGPRTSHLRFDIDCVWTRLEFMEDNVIYVSELLCRRFMRHIWKRYVCVAIMHHAMIGPIGYSGLFAQGRWASRVQRNTYMRICGRQGGRTGKIFTPMNHYLIRLVRCVGAQNKQGVIFNVDI